MRSVSKHNIGGGCGGGIWALCVLGLTWVLVVISVKHSRNKATVITKLS